MIPITGLDTAEGREADEWPAEGFYRITSPRFRPREQKIPSSIFEYGSEGFNNVCLMHCPMRICEGENWGIQYRRQWLWQAFCIRFNRVRRFLSHGEYLGTEIPTHLLAGTATIQQADQMDLFAL